jgi:hypothetical protein
MTGAAASWSVWAGVFDALVMIFMALMLAGR